jgi:N-acylglucosamine 2-epimerase
VVDGADSIYTDGFAMMGLAAYYRLTVSSHAAAMLRETCQSVRARLAAPGSYGIRPYHLPPGTKAHAIDMLFSLAFWEAGQALEERSIIEEGIRHAREVLAHFVFEDDHAIREFLDLENRALAGSIGTCCLPGHALESMWALMRIFRAIGETRQIGRCAEIIRWHLEKGWDQEFGGIFLAIDLAGRAPYWPYADYKPWWPAVEAMYALLLAYAETREPWCLTWYERVHNYAFSHYPVRPDGEWRNRLDRQGKPVEEVIALPVKDPFHLPRALMLSSEILRTMADGQETVELAAT